MEPIFAVEVRTVETCILNGSTNRGGNETFLGERPVVIPITILLQHSVTILRNSIRASSKSINHYTHHDHVLVYYYYRCSHRLPSLEQPVCADRRPLDDSDGALL
jgi:hypothetical protein